ncbi:methyltransferase domain-containing protein [Streptomyces sp. NPDC057638]|uniref:methyltransferase domain-containing protein n=1 Tax=Streptomyces sp. NPDC057638 TaxID=3346190 RepID=UPI0036B7CF2E
MSSTTATDMADARERLVDALTAGGALAAGSAWRGAFASVPREVFAPRFTLSGLNGGREYAPGDRGYAAAVYTDTTLITRRDATGAAVSSSSEPSLMARMLEAFTVREAARVLEIGTGTGYNTALLCHRLGADRVTSIDVEPELTALARTRLAGAGFTPLVVTGDGTGGHAEGAPYDGILATCGVQRIPSAWPGQVRPGGIIVTNIGNGIARLTVDGDGGAEGGFLPEDAAFMLARPAPDYLAPAAAQFTGLIARGTGTRRVMELPLPAAEPTRDLPGIIRATAHEVWMVQHDVLSLSLTSVFASEAGEMFHGLVHPPTGSWARITPQEGRRVLVEHEGPRDLWAERLALVAQWIDAGRPGPGAYTLTVTGTGAHTLRRTGPAPATWAL